MDPAPPVSLPIMRSSRSPVFTISTTGAGQWHHYPGRPGWLSSTELKGADRWELPGQDIVWVLCPRYRTVQRRSETSVANLDASAADVVSDLGTGAIFDHCSTDADRLAWTALLDVAGSITK
jgi:hypothetical protein